MTKKMAQNREKMRAKLNVLKIILVIVDPFREPSFLSTVPSRTLPLRRVLPGQAFFKAGVTDDERGDDGHAAARRGKITHRRNRNRARTRRRGIDVRRVDVVATARTAARGAEILQR